MKNKKTLIPVVILITVLVACVMFLIGKNTGNNAENTMADVIVDDDIKIKENVVIYTEKTSERKRPFAVEENLLKFNKNPKYEENTVIVSDITEEAPAGFIRKVISVEKTEDCHIVYTEPAQLTDVFEELHLSATVELTEDENGDLEISENNAELLFISPKILLSTTSISGTNKKENTKEVKSKLFEIEFDEDFNAELEEDISVFGNVGATIWLDIRIDISKGKLNEFEMTLNDELTGEMLVGFGVSASKEYEKEIFNKPLPKITIQAGPVPIVITNEVSAKFECGASIEGEIGTTIKLTSTSKNGFVYTANDESIKEINQNEISDDNLIEFNTGATAKGAVNTGISLAVTSQFYDCLGTELRAGINGEVEGELSIDNKTINTEELYYGKLTMSITPNVQGKIVGNVPILGNDLFDITLFEKEFKPIWEADWSNVHPLKEKNAFELLGVTYKEIVDCFGTDYRWYDGNGAPVMYYPTQNLKYGVCFGTVSDRISESSTVTSVLVSAQGKELYKGVCIGDDISDLERVTGQAAYQYFDEMEGVNSYSIEIENVTVWGYLEGTKILTATLKQAV